ncbi:SDR family NAD(P)-dependent oxidoreductase OS=Streptomyces rutgersensis OX=53451 GN=F0345_01405 PE=4 SV=1 [Streptomyces diastaticus subsp. diastaticus]
MPATTVYDYPTSQALAEHLVAELLGEQDTPGPDRATLAALAEDPVVIVGMACRLPGGVRSPQELWAMLSEGRDGIDAFPEDRGGPRHPDDRRSRRPGPQRHPARWIPLRRGRLRRPLLRDLPTGGAGDDPQQRLPLETTWEAFERSGIDADGLRGAAPASSSAPTARTTPPSS